MADLKTWKGFSCVRSDVTKEGASIKDMFFTCDFKRNFAEIGAFKSINVHLTYSYNKSNIDDQTGVFQIAITQFHDVTYDRVFNSKKQIEGFISTDQEQIFNEFKKIFSEEDFLNRYFAKAFEQVRRQ